jgi:hypothetical protein
MAVKLLAGELAEELTGISDGKTTWIVSCTENPSVGMKRRVMEVVSETVLLTGVAEALGRVLATNPERGTERRSMALPLLSWD